MLANGSDPASLSWNADRTQLTVNTPSGISRVEPGRNLDLHAAPLKRTGTAKVTALAQQKFAFQGTPSQTCLTDSGAPVLHERDGVEYVAGVSSSGDAHCREYAQAMLVDAFADDFILPAIADSGRSYGCQPVPVRGPGPSLLVLALVLLRAAAGRTRRSRIQSC